MRVSCKACLRVVEPCFILPIVKMNNLAAILSYKQAPLAFGTSGLRALVKDSIDLDAYISVKATLRYLSSIGDIASGGAE